MLDTSRSARIRAINDYCRQTFTGCAVVVTAAFTALDPEIKARALNRVRTFTAFDDGNDPHDA